MFLQGGLELRIRESGPGVLRGNGVLSGGGNEGLKELESVGDGLRVMGSRGCGGGRVDGMVGSKGGEGGSVDGGGVMV